MMCAENMIDHHGSLYLDILQCEVLPKTAPMKLEPRHESCRSNEDANNGGDSRVYADGQVITVITHRDTN